MSALLVVCTACRNPVVNNESDTIEVSIPIEFPKQPEYFYIFYHDSLYSDGVVLENGIDPDTVTAIFGPLGSAFVYDFSTLPNPAWVERIPYEDPNNYEECYLLAETLYCPSDTDFINWLIACPNSEF